MVTFPSGDALFATDLIAEYVRSPLFVQRSWLYDQVQSGLLDPQCRFILITAEPGAGKTGLVAALAHRNPTWVRYFIRRDSTVPLNRADARSFLISVGCQLATLAPAAFVGTDVLASARQTITTVDPGGEVI